MLLFFWLLHLPLHLLNRRWKGTIKLCLFVLELGLNLIEEIYLVLELLMKPLDLLLTVFFFYRNRILLSFKFFLCLFRDTLFLEFWLLLKLGLKLFDHNVYLCLLDRPHFLLKFNRTSIQFFLFGQNLVLLLFNIYHWLGSLWSNNLFIWNLAWGKLVWVLVS